VDAQNLDQGGRLEMPRLLEPFRRSIEATVQPCLSLACREAPGAVAGSRFGGVPLVPWGTAWPQSPKRPMTFLGQLNFGHLAGGAGAALPLLPTAGVLCLFYDLEEQRWGFDPEDSAYWRLTFVPDAEQAVALMPPASVREALAPHGLLATAAASLPSPGDGHQARFPVGFARYLRRSYASLHAGFQRRHLAASGSEHQVLGHPHWMDRDARAIAELASAGVYCGDWSVGPAGNPEPVEAPGDWRLLWQIGSDDAVGLHFGSGGMLYVLIRETDLRARAFGRAWLIQQCP
jgi:uncharacterized protein YwqG